MGFDSDDSGVKPLLLIGGQSSRMETRKELLSFPNGCLAFKNALSTLHSAISTASTIFISIHEECQKAGIAFRLKDPTPLFLSDTPTSHNDDDHRVQTPSLQVIVDRTGQDIGPAGGLLAAYALDPDTTWLVLACDYPLLPASALQQLILEYGHPVTCFVNKEGFAEPLIGIWSSEALVELKENVESGRSGLNNVVRAVNGKLVTPLREEWIRGANTKNEWDEISNILKGQYFEE